MGVPVRDEEQLRMDEARVCECQRRSTRMTWICTPFLMVTAVSLMKSGIVYSGATVLIDMHLVSEWVFHTLFVSAILCPLIGVLSLFFYKKQWLPLGLVGGFVASILLAFLPAQYMKMKTVSIPVEPVQTKAGYEIRVSNLQQELQSEYGADVGVDNFLGNRVLVKKEMYSDQLERDIESFIKREFIVKLEEWTDVR